VPGVGGRPNTAHGSGRREELVYGRSRGRFRDFSLRGRQRHSSWWGWLRPASGTPVGLTRPIVTYAGSTVDNTAGVLARTDAAFVSYTRDHHGRSQHTRVLLRPGRSQARTDVSPNLFCGPVLFYGGAAPAMYLRYAVSPSGTRVNGHLRLSVANQPYPAKPVRIPAGRSWSARTAAQCRTGRGLVAAAASTTTTTPWSGEPRGSAQSSFRARHVGHRQPLHQHRPQGQRLGSVLRRGARRLGTSWREVAGVPAADTSGEMAG